MPLTLSIESYRRHCDDSDGYCLECLAFTRTGDTEPDAEGYECPTCHEDSCMGAEQAMLTGNIKVK